MDGLQRSKSMEGLPTLCLKHQRERSAVGTKGPEEEAQLGRFKDQERRSLESLDSPGKMI